MLERDLQKESCSCSKIVQVNTEFLAERDKDSESNWYERGKAGVDEGGYNIYCVLLKDRRVTK
jgi:hypothetical protein